VVNPQDAGPETRLVSTAADTADVPVVEFTETLPEADDYVEWMRSNLDAVRSVTSGRQPLP